MRLNQITTTPTHKHAQALSIVAALLELFCFCSVHVEHLFQTGLADSIVCQDESFLVRFNAGKDARDANTLRGNFVSSLVVLAFTQHRIRVVFRNELIHFTHAQFAGTKDSQLIQGLQSHGGILPNVVTNGVVLCDQRGQIIATVSYSLKDGLHFLQVEEDIISSGKTAFNIFLRASSVLCLEQVKCNLLVIFVITTNQLDLQLNLVSLTKLALQVLCRSQAPEASVGHDTNTGTQGLTLLHGVGG
mmetsp:Transcript_5114/g.12797  ORF Transcript_5114/g.12797 Transcript_5114/m.12797 type:complete len:246 (-) Transcript_5114:587-1324(-)